MPWALTELQSSPDSFAGSDAPCEAFHAVAQSSRAVFAHLRAVCPCSSVAVVLVLALSQLASFLPKLSIRCKKIRSRNDTALKRWP